jgi:hypothetical protein
MRRTARDEPALDDARLLELVEALRKRRRRDARERLPELVETDGTAGAGVDRAQRPAALQELRYRAKLRGNR